jgi:hypothetical protein
MGGRGRRIARPGAAGQFFLAPGEAARACGRHTRDPTWGTMQIDFTTLPLRDAYALMTTSIMPRPVAWVSTISPGGRTNLAPFSFFQGVTANPPTLLIVPVNTATAAGRTPRATSRRPANSS